MAAHVIEHVPDLCGWLREMSDALKISGRLLLVIPDKRFTFDIYRRLSSFEEVIHAWQERRRRPGLRLVIDHFANVVKADTSELWENYALADHLHYYHGPEFLSLAAREHAEGKYIDVHCWVFTPWHFMHLMGRMVREMGLNFDLRYFLTTQDHDIEFYVQLEKVTALTTDWAQEAEAARRGALWPRNMPDVPADGLLREMGGPTRARPPQPRSLSVKPAAASGGERVPSGSGGPIGGQMYITTFARRAGCRVCASPEFECRPSVANLLPATSLTLMRRRQGMLCTFIPASLGRRVSTELGPTGFDGPL